MDLSNISSDSLLNFIVENDIINIDDVQNQMNKKRRKKLLKQHPYEIWQGKDLRWRTYIDDSTKKSGRRLIPKTNKEDLLDFLVKHYDEEEKSCSLDNITLEKLYPQWLDYKSLHTNAKNYIRRIDNDWKKYYLDTDIIKLPIKKLDKLTLDTWAHHLIQDNHMTKTQYYNSAVIMRQSLDYAVDLKIISSNPLTEVHIDGKRLFKRVKKKPDNTQVFFRNEVDCISTLAWTDFYENTRLIYKLAPLAILFQFQTGLRIGELCVIRYEDIESPTKIHIQRMYRNETHEIVEHTKGYNERYVLLTGLAKKIISIAKEYQEQHGLKSDGYIFSLDTKPLSVRSVEHLYTKYCNEIDTIHKSSHKTRKTYISALIDGQVNLNTIREMVGHSDERTTLGNYCFDRSTETEKAALIEDALCH